MRFARLRLNGFKSFVDPTDLVIAEGLTGVVGPNGCGKSNLLEALRWVMGENRPTAMRGGGMEDVIFDGAATRGARNFAEVSVTLDNRERLAPRAFNADDQLEIVRRITRDAGSAYKANGKDVRARDVQMLFADASTGAHSPALVRQGQIAELINAKPRARRRVLEEAAGISGLYQRRHEAELKLNGAESNLERVDDVLEQLAQQLSVLTRQAKQAKRYREISAGLRRAEGLLLYLRWRDADLARAEAEAALAQVVTDAAGAERAVLAAAEQREAAELALPPCREEEAVAAALLQRVHVERDRLDDEEARIAATLATLEARIDQMGQDIAREDSLNADAGQTIHALTAEAEALDAAGAGHEAALDAAAIAAKAAAETLAEEEAGHGALTEEVAQAAARHQAAERRLDDAQLAAKRHGAEAETARATASETEARLAEIARDHAAAQAALVKAQDLASRAEATVAETEAARNMAQTRETEARKDRAEAEGQVTALDAEMRAVAKLVERARGAQDHVLEAIRVTPDFETAVGAALADDLKAPLAPALGQTGWTELPDFDTPQPLPDGVPALSQFADAPRALDRRLSQVGVVSVEEGHRLHSALRPGQRLVSRAGDLWRWDGFVQSAEDATSTAARHLAQLNRLNRLSADLERATKAADRAIAAHDHVADRLRDLSQADQKGREMRRLTERDLADASRASSQLEAERTVLAGRLETLKNTAARHAEEAAAAEENCQAAQAALAELGDLGALRAQAADRLTAVEAARLAMIARQTAHEELRREGEARHRRRTQIAAERVTWQDRLATASDRIAELQTRKAASEAEHAAALALPADIAARRTALAQTIAEAETRRAAAADALSLAETAERSAVATERNAERAASEAREARARAETRCEAAQDSVIAAKDRIAEALNVSPEDLLHTLAVDPEGLPSAESIEADVTRLRRQRDALGAVNLRAEEDAQTVEAEYDALALEKGDLEAAIAKLRSGIAALNKEGRQRLLVAFDEVNRNFSALFTHLFAGGEAKLVLVESDDPLEAGLEILCQPPGKKLATLSLLSGGEQTLTALALIFAVFLANPAPICVLDEVDAPLDDANVARFCDLLDEMCRRTQTRFLIITHHAVTMSRMDRLFGVTMAEQGVSQLVSVDLTKAEQMVA